MRVCKSIDELAFLPRRTLTSGDRFAEKIHWLNHVCSEIEHLSMLINRIG